MITRRLGSGHDSSKCNYIDNGIVANGIIAISATTIMRFLKDDLNIDFLAKRYWAFALSGLLLAAGLATAIARGGLNYGIDFSGGTIVQVQFEEQQDIGTIRQTLADGNIGSFALQTFGAAENNEFLVTVGKASQEQSIESESAAQEIQQVLKAQFPNMQMRRVESVGPKVGKELKSDAGAAILFSLIAILLYVWLRFQWRYSVGALVALTHDVLIVLVAFAATQKEITLPVVAAILTVAGYSINDTIVIFDRIRENFRKFQKKPGMEIVNESVNQTLNRTLLTSGTTLFVLMSIYLFGGEIINDFAFALLIGVVAGTYSSIFIASPVFFGLRQAFPQKPR